MPRSTSSAHARRQIKGRPRWKPTLSIAQILAWADQYHARHGEWPTPHSGPIHKARGESWMAVGVALRHGKRGLPHGDSLARLLARHRKKRNLGDLPSLKIRRILAWADAHLARAGVWPTQESGPISDAPGESWMAVQHALYHGSRGLPGGSSLFRLLARHRGIRRHVRRPQYKLARILQWADAFVARHGRWPTRRDGPIVGTGETWVAVDSALKNGFRGLPGGDSLAELLDRRRRKKRVR